jgi:hypothetical protein
MQMEPFLSEPFLHPQHAGEIQDWDLLGIESAAVIGRMTCSALCALPAAQSISASTIASLLRLAVKQQRFEWGVLLCRLPGAQQLPSQQLCELLLQLLLPQRCAEDRAAELQDLIMALSGLRAARQMSPGAAMQLMSTLIQKSSTKQRTLRAVLDDANAPGVLAAVGSQLTGGELLQLLQQAADLG